MRVSGKIEAVAAAALFDADGVLVDSAASIRRTVAHWANLHGIDPAVAAEAWHGRRAIDAILELVPDADGAVEDALHEDVEVADAVTVTAMPGALDLVSLPDLRWAVVTGGSNRLVRARLTAAGLPEPPVLVTGDMVSAGKPDPEGYLLAASLLGVAAEACVVVEDADAGVAAGLAAGCHVIGFGPLVTVDHPRVTRLDDLRRLRVLTSRQTTM